MNTTELTQLTQLLDREAIRECIYKYCRGIDRCDEEALRSTYWSDATDQHGAYSGGADGFISWALQEVKQSPRMLHMVGNISIVLKGKFAAVESYFLGLRHDNDSAGKLRKTLLFGRYIDKFEKRDEEWRVVHRRLVYDWIEEAPGLAGDDATRFGSRNPNGKHKPEDPWYDLLAQSPFLENFTTQK